MTQKEFWRRARQGRKWAPRNYDGAIRCLNGACPLMAVAVPGRPGVCNATWAAAELGLAPTFAEKVAQGADFRWSQHRRWLLKNLGVRAPHEETR